MWDDRSPHPNPANATAMMWTAWEPDPSDNYLRRERKLGKGYPRRWRYAQSAMAEVDRLFPLPNAETSRAP